MVTDDPVIKKHLEILKIIHGIKHDRLLILFNEYHTLRTNEIIDIKKKIDAWLKQESKADHNFIDIQKIKNELHDKDIEIRNEFEKELNARSRYFEKKLNAFEKMMLARPRLCGFVLLVWGRKVFMPKVDDK